MLSSIRYAVREWFFYDVKEHFHTMISHIRSSLFDDMRTWRDQQAAAYASRPALACVTIDCVAMEGDRATPSVVGGEIFVRPNATSTIRVHVMRQLKLKRYFLSGHPNLVIERFRVGNTSVESASGGTKFGDCDVSVAVGNLIQIEVSYRSEEFVA